MPAARITVEQFRELMEQHLPFAEAYPLEILAIGFGTSKVRVPFRPKFVRPGGTLNGPLLMATADVAMYAALLGAIGLQPLAVTSQLSINFLRKPSPAALWGTCRLLKTGKRLAVGEVELFTEGEPEMVAHAVSTYAIPAK